MLIFSSYADLLECKNLMCRFIAEKPDVWMEDIGEDDPGVSLATATSTDALRELSPGGGAR